MRRLVRTVTGVLALGLAAGCGSSGSGAAATTTSSPGTTSTTSGAEALAEEHPGTPGKDRQLRAAVDSYRSYLLAEVAALRTGTSAFTAAVRAGDLAKARARYSPSRVHWGRLSPVTGAVRDITARVDGLATAHSGPADPAFTGWHRLEYLLWVTGSTAAARPYADQLDADLATLAARLATVPLTPGGLVLGARGAVETMATRTLAGMAEPYSHTDLADLAAGLDGAQAVFRALTPVVAAADPTLVAVLLRDFDAATSGVSVQRVAGGGYRPVGDLTAADRSRLRGRLDALRADMLRLAAVPGLR
ncbi:MAG: EfeM/EfeO family lipoprotein [Actinobacteria bacterium]|nr:EfeM/EfeO family lipoprotein [Actinomycetota bacterium]MBI3687622.1 EfeM/EfeO family lipoprotein [Actinomycetota bacterium]